MSATVHPLVDATPRGSGWSYVYRHIAADGAVLYVGCSTYPRARTRQHEVRSPWWAEVDLITWHGPFDSRDDALDFERDLIRKHQPPHNQVGTAKHQGWRAVSELEHAERAVARAEEQLRVARERLAAVKAKGAA